MSKKMICPYCGKKIQYTEQEQTPGFRFPEELVCPHCLKVVKESLEYEFFVEPVDDE